MGKKYEFVKLVRNHIMKIDSLIPGYDFGDFGADKFKLDIQDEYIKFLIEYARKLKPIFITEYIEEGSEFNIMRNLHIYINFKNLLYRSGYEFEEDDYLNDVDKSFILLSTPLKDLTIMFRGYEYIKTFEILTNNDEDFINRVFEMTRFLNDRIYQPGKYKDDLKYVLKYQNLELGYSFEYLVDKDIFHRELSEVFKEYDINHIIKKIGLNEFKNYKYKSVTKKTLIKTLTYADYNEFNEIHKHLKNYILENLLDDIREDSSQDIIDELTELISKVNIPGYHQLLHINRNNISKVMRYETIKKYIKEE